MKTGTDGPAARNSPRLLSFPPLEIAGTVSPPSEEDRRIFVSLQIERYLKRKPRSRFCSRAERDAVEDIIALYWERLKTRNLSGIGREEKTRLFMGFAIVFPYFVAEAEDPKEPDFWETLTFRGEF